MRRAQLISLATATALAVACADGPTSITGSEGSSTRFQVTQQQGPYVLTLTPATATNPAGEGGSHTLTARLTDAMGQPVPNVTVSFFGEELPEANSLGGQCTTDAGGQCTFTYTRQSLFAGGVGFDRISAFADVDKDGPELDDPSAQATKVWEALVLTLSPVTATNPVGTTHTVTAQVRGLTTGPTPNRTVFFRVTGAANTSGQCTTGPNGQCSFSYTATVPGTDVIRAWVDVIRDETEGQNEPTAVANKVWAPPAPGCPANGGDDDEDDDGLEDSEENLFSTLLGVADSDGDGIVDGNDDSDGDGVDDEDEDDDSDDDCPNDSDGDGVDDEDEDDGPDDD